MSAAGARRTGRTASARTRALRMLGGVLLGAGGLLAATLVYQLVVTNIAAGAAQAQLRAAWAAAAPTASEGDGGAQAPRASVRAGASALAATVGEPSPGADAGAETAGAPEPAPERREGAARTDPAERRGPVALLRFDRPGAEEPPVHAEPLVVVGGVRLEDLRRGPGHYPGTAGPGEPGNFAVAGHRTTRGAPFLHLDELEIGDRVEAVDRSGRSHSYRVVAQEIVAPAASWVLGPDPLGLGAPMLTLTTCHPRYSARERLVVFAVLDEADAALSAAR